jgi:hypothetical protein
LKRKGLVPKGNFSQLKISNNLFGKNISIPLRSWKEGVQSQMKFHTIEKPQKKFVWKIFQRHIWGFEMKRCRCKWYFRQLKTSKNSLKKLFQRYIWGLEKKGWSFKWNLKQLKTSKISLGKIFLSTFKVLKRRSVVLNEISNNCRPQSFTFKAHLKPWKDKGLGPKQDSRELKTSNQF